MSRLSLGDGGSAHVAPNVTQLGPAQATIVVVGRYLREGGGALLLLSALGLIGLGVTHLRDQEFVGAALLSLCGLMLVRAGVELLRPSMGE